MIAWLWLLARLQSLAEHEDAFVIEAQQYWTDGDAEHRTLQAAARACRALWSFVRSQRMMSRCSIHRKVPSIGLSRYRPSVVILGGG